MPPQLVPRRTLMRLTVAAVVLLFACAVVLGLAELLSAMGDAAGSLVLKYVALAIATMVALDLLCLVLALALRGLLEEEHDEQSPGQ